MPNKESQLHWKMHVHTLFDSPYSTIQVQYAEDLSRANEALAKQLAEVSARAESTAGDASRLRTDCHRLQKDLNETRAQHGMDSKRMARMLEDERCAACLPVDAHMPCFFSHGAHHVL